MKSAFVSVVIALVAVALAIGLFVSESSKRSELEKKVEELQTTVEQQQAVIESLEGAGPAAEAPDMTEELQNAIDQRIAELKDNLDLSKFVTEDNISNFVTQEKVKEMSDKLSQYADKIENAMQLIKDLEKQLSKLKELGGSETPKFPVR
ncbi:MAG: hypothetical protein U5N86_01945 [Planctomycetota bacterium]|nr:hypothetical protein [Planctomycetota bacterium]